MAVSFPIQQDVQKKLATGNYNTGADSALYYKGYGQNAQNANQPQQNSQALYNAGLEANKKAARDVQYDWNGNNTNGVTFSNVKTDNMENGNPIARGGRAKMTVAGQTFDVPNAVAQFQTYQQAWNQGRYQPFQQMTQQATSQRAKAAGLGDNYYTSYGSLKGQLNSWFNRNPEWEKDKPMNQYYADQERARELEAQKADLQTRNQYVTETASPTGITSSSYQNNDALMAKLNAEISQIQNKRNDRAYMNKYYGRGVGAPQDVTAMLENYQPTISNLPIEETFLSN
jgi:hypothetical protein